MSTNSVPRDTVLPKTLAEARDAAINLLGLPRPWPDDGKCYDPRCRISDCELNHTREQRARRLRAIEVEVNEMTGAELRAAWEGGR